MPDEDALVAIRKPLRTLGAMSYRVALLVGSLDVSGPARQVAEWARNHPSIDMAAILLDRSSGNEAGTPAAHAALRIIGAIERHMVFRTRERRDHISSIAGDVPVMSLSAASSEEKMEAVRDLKLDAIIDVTGRQPRGDLAPLARDGVIRVVYGDGGVGAFREVLGGRPATGFTVQRQRQAEAEAEILFRGSVTTQLFYTESLEALGARSTPYLLRTVERLAAGDQGRPETVENPRPAPFGLAEVFTYAARTLRRVGHKAWRHARGREWNWGVAYIFAPWKDADLSAGKILPKLPGTFVADPFVAELGDKRYIFVEEFPYSTRKGVISVFEVDETHATRLGVAIEEPYHLSFPFVFQKDGVYFMVPEGQGGGELVLYECTDFPLQWRRKKVVMPKVCADTVVFEQAERWWMLTSIKGEGRAENSAELHAFYAEDPLGEWQPHSKNPVVMDASKGRNGGLLTDEEGRTYRVAQRAGFRTYGDAFAIFRIDELTPDSYRETLVREVEPDFFPQLAGAHHMHSRGGLTVYDFNRDERP